MEKELRKINLVDKQIDFMVTRFLGWKLPENFNPDNGISLGHVPDIAKVAEIIGNKSWSYVRCEGCGYEVEEAVSIGEYDAKSYCKTCIEEAKTILNL